METENKFVVRGKVDKIDKSYGIIHTTKSSDIIEGYRVVIKTESFGIKMYVSVFYWQPQVAQEGDEVEATGFITSFSSTYDSTIHGKSLTVLNPSNSAQPTSN